MEKKVDYSPSEIEIIAQIDYHYFILKKVQGELAKPKTEIEKWIDEATGYGKIQNAQYIETCINCLSEIIRLKEVLGITSEIDKMYLAQLKEVSNVKS